VYGRKVAIEGINKEDIPPLPAQPAGNIYRQFLSQLCQLTGASAASLYFDVGSGPRREPLLLHSGQTEASPEFASIDTAGNTVAQYSGFEAATTAPGIQCFPSSADESCLVQLRADALPVEAAGEHHPERRQPVPATESGVGEAVWLALRYDTGSVPTEIMELDTPPPGQPGNAKEWLAHSLLTSGAFLREASRLQALSLDPTSQLPGRAEFQARLKAIMNEFRGRASLGLLLINPDEFELVNRRLDRDSGDTALAQMAAMLCDCLRRTDDVFHYGGAVFAVQMPGASREVLPRVAEKIRDSLTGAYLSGAMRLSFSIGGALYDPGSEQDDDLDDLGLLRRADQALNAAKGQGGGCSVVWQPGENDQELIGRDRLSGIFTANAEKDYRNMLVLWDIIAMVSQDADEQRLAAGFVERIQLAMRPSWAALYRHLEGGRTSLMSQSGRASFPPGQHPSEVETLIAKARELGRAERGRRPPGPGDRDHGEDRLGYAVPLMADGRAIACLYLEGSERDLSLDSSDLVFLNALSTQLALALDRVDLAERWRNEQKRESRRLRNEVQGLRQAVQSARLIYHSRQMDALLETARAAAPTDVTVLINGESGTGKEMLARAVHELSARNGKAFVTVDCGSIAANLMEAELFGAVKGAYTGADRVAAGRIVQADGGTLFLDEIGEVPLDVQVKLLRFVQEKEIHPVGAETPRRVDVRIIAATNRDLAREAAEGRFREDLYYRLNVVTLTAPPLRDRPDDILPLAGHFLERFALQYEKGLRRFSPEAENLLLSHSWPGNVRELQNGILRAVVLSTNETIEATDLVFEDGPGETQPSVEGAQPPTSSPTPSSVQDVQETDQPWQELGIRLGQQVDAALASSGKAVVPLGRWLSEDLVLTVDQKERGKTTFRRQLEKARRLQDQGLLARSDAWGQFQGYIDRLADTMEDESRVNLMELARNELLEAVLARVGNDDATGSALMGITIPTYRRWREQA
jgi:diguanylate cyclase (GGDEF)-like protein